MAETEEKLTRVKNYDMGLEHLRETKKSGMFEAHEMEDREGIGALQKIAKNDSHFSS